MKLDVKRGYLEIPTKVEEEMETLVVRIKASQRCPCPNPRNLKIISGYMAKRD